MDSRAISNLPTSRPHRSLMVSIHAAGKPVPTGRGAGARRSHEEALESRQQPYEGRRQAPVAHFVRQVATS